MVCIYKIENECLYMITIIIFPPPPTPPFFLLQFVNAEEISSVGYFVRTVCEILACVFCCVSIAVLINVVLIQILSYRAR